MLGSFKWEASGDWPCFEPVWDRTIQMKQDKIMRANALAPQRASAVMVSNT